MQQEHFLSKALKPKVRQPWGALAALIVGTLAYIFAQISLGVVIGVLSAAKGEDAALESLDQPWLSLVLNSLMFAVMLGIVWVFLKSKNFKIREFGFKVPTLKQLGWAVVAYIAYIVAIAITFVALGAFVPSFNVDEAQDIGFVGAQGWQLVLAFISLVIIAPICEEVFFRGFIYKGLKRSWPRWIAVIATSALFGLVHWQWNVAVDVFLLSLALIFVYEKTGNLWMCIAIHATKNCIAFLALFVFVVK